MIDTLMLRDEAQKQLAQITTIETGVEYLNKVKAIETWAKAEKKDAKLQNAIAEQKLRTQKILGGLLKDNNKELKARSQGSTQLSDFGISKNESSKFQKIASMPEELFEQEIAQAKDESSKRIELTTSRLLQAAKDYEQSEKKAQKINEIKKQSKEFKNTDIQIFNKDFRELKIEDSSIDLILTDPPYPAEYLHLWKDLFIQAKRVLKPNKFIVAYSGQMYLDKIFKYATDAGLDYYWIINIEFTKKPLIHGRKVLNEWKPILIFQNGLKQHDRVFSDKISMKYTEREMHDLNWGQTVEPFEFLLDRFSNPNDLVYEPFAGTGTTLLACKNKNRKCIGTEIKKEYIDLIKGRLK